MTVFLDTNACIAIANRRSTAVRKRLQDVVNARERVGIPVIVAFELWYGAEKSLHRDHSIERLTALLGRFELVALDSDDGRFAAQIRADLERKGTPIGPYDLLIAAQALRHDAVLVTANEREFSRVTGLRVENWAA